MDDAIASHIIRFKSRRLRELLIHGHRVYTLSALCLIRCQPLPGTPCPGNSIDHRTKVIEMTPNLVCWRPSAFDPNHACNHGDHQTKANKRPKISPRKRIKRTGVNLSVGLRSCSSKNLCKLKDKKILALQPLWMVKGGNRDSRI